MLPTGSGFFAMWNGIPPELGEAFPLMHARDHLAEHLAYLGRDGILWARRHGDGQGTLPPFFAWYAMTSLAPLTDPEFADRKVHETAWFKAIRPQFRDRIAHHCNVLASAGGGIGGAVATFLVDLGDTTQAEALMDRLTRLPAVTAAHLGAVDWTVPARVGFPLPVPEPGDERLGVVIAEGFDRFRLAAAMPAIAQHLQAAGVITRMRRSGHYAFSYALDHDAIAALRHYRRDSRPDREPG